MPGRSPGGCGGSGKLPWQGVGWYRKTFTLDEADQGSACTWILTA